MKRALLFCSSFIIVTAFAALLYFALSPRHEKLRAAVALPDVSARLGAAADALSFEGRRFRAIFGSAKAQYLLARDYASGDFGPRDSEASLELLKAAADGGYPQAQLSLARLYFIGEGVGQDDAAGAALVRRAAEEGSSYAKALMGMLTIGGIGTAQDADEALTWLKSSNEKEAPVLAQQLEQDLADINSLPAETRKPALDKYYARRKAAIRSVFDNLLQALKSAPKEDDAGPDDGTADTPRTDTTTQKDHDNGH